MGKIISDKISNQVDLIQHLDNKQMIDKSYNNKNINESILEDLANVESYSSGSPVSERNFINNEVNTKIINPSNFDSQEITTNFVDISEDPIQNNEIVTNIIDTNVSHKNESQEIVTNIIDPNVPQKHQNLDIVTDIIHDDRILENNFDTYSDISPINSEKSNISIKDL